MGRHTGRLRGINQQPNSESKCCGIDIVPQALGQPLRAVWGDPTEATRWRLENDAVTAGSESQTSLNVNRDIGGPVLQITGQLGINSQPEAVALAVLTQLHIFTAFSPRPDN
jgi:D-alanyl-D-alanine carboxypeptidase/D-alanyl-D-alanine-endopeptidase (penicillin-binding protein 4)